VRVVVLQQEYMQQRLGCAVVAATSRESNQRCRLLRDQLRPSCGCAQYSSACLNMTCMRAAAMLAVLLAAGSGNPASLRMTVRRAHSLIQAGLCGPTGYISVYLAFSTACC
jgi:hypothetical protein